MKQPDYTLYLVTDSHAVYQRGFLATIEAAIAGGVSIVQYRADNQSKRDLYKTGLLLRDLLRRLEIPLIINNHVDLALALDADGVHVGQSDLPASVVRRVIGKNKLLGLSVSNSNECRAVDNTIVDYVGIGPVFPTQSKLNAAPAIGINDLRALAALTALPTVAIGGISPTNAASVYATGVNGIAVVSAISRAEDAFAAAQALRASKSQK